MNVLVVAAHPDDEVLGVGATVARHAEAGDAVHILICAQGHASRQQAAEGQLEALREAGRRAARVLGARPPRFLGFPDNAMDGVPLLHVVKGVEAVVAEVEPAIVYTHHAGDLNIDHRIACRATLTACRPLPGTPIRAIHAFETLSSTEWAVPGEATPFTPTHFVDAGPWLERKIEALRCYAGELREFPHPRSLEGVRHLAALRGASAGLAAAEAFVTLRTTWPAATP